MHSPEIDCQRISASRNLGTQLLERAPNFARHLAGQVHVETELADALSSSRSVLSQFGNMSSATVMFVLREIMQHAQSGQQGCAMSFGPGLTAETMLFHAA